MQKETLDNELFSRFSNEYYEIVKVESIDDLKAYHTEFLEFENVNPQDKIAFYQKAIQHDLRKKVSLGFGIHLSILLENHLLLKQYGEVIQVYEQMKHEPLFNKIPYNTKLTILNLYQQALENSGNIRAALEVVKYRSHFKDSLTAVANDRLVLDLEKKYEVEQKEKEIIEAASNY